MCGGLVSSETMPRSMMIFIVRRALGNFRRQSVMQRLGIWTIVVATSDNINRVQKSIQNISSVWNGPIFVTVPPFK